MTVDSVGWSRRDSTLPMCCHGTNLNEMGVILCQAFDFFYGRQSEQFSFFRIPKLLFTDKRFSRMSTDSKVLYGLLLDRMNLSAKNQWLDDQGRVYIFFTTEEIMEDLNCGNKKACQLMAELDSVGLIFRIRQGQGKPSIIYVKNFILDSS